MHFVETFLSRLWVEKPQLCLVHICSTWKKNVWDWEIFGKGVSLKTRLTSQTLPQVSLFNNDSFYTKYIEAKNATPYIE